LEAKLEIGKNNISIKSGIFKKDKQHHQQDNAVYQTVV